MANISLFLDDFRGNAAMCETVDNLSALRRALLSESSDKELTAAAAALEKARAAYNTAAVRVVLADDAYNGAQTALVRACVHEWARAHKAAAFARWFDANGKDAQTGVVDTVQRLSSHIAHLYDDFTAGAKVAKRKKQTTEELKATIAAKQAELAALLAQAEG